MAGRLWDVSRRQGTRREKLEPVNPTRLKTSLLFYSPTPTLTTAVSSRNWSKKDFKGKVICTKATLDLCEVMLQDSGHIQEMEAEWQNRKGKRAGKGEAIPLYTMKDAEKCLRYFQTVNYDEIIQLADGVKVRFQDAGHILGSAIIEIWVEEGGRGEKIGLLGRFGQFGPTHHQRSFWVEEGDVLWLESTYGNRLHKIKGRDRSGIVEDHSGSHCSSGKGGHSCLCRGANSGYHLHARPIYQKRRLFPPIPIYIDSPLAISATEIFKRNSDCFDQETKDLLSGGENPLEIPGIVYTRTTEESKAINEDPRPGIIISASGMCDSGRIKHHLKHHLWREESHIVIIGYQAEGTIGRRIVDGAKTVRLFGEEIAVKAHIHTLGGFSAHADQKGLLDWLSHINNPKLEVFVNHGEEKISMELSQLIRERFHFKTTVPQWREKRVLFDGEEKVMSEERGEEGLPPEESFTTLFSHLDRTYKRLRRKLRREKKKGEDVYDSRWLKQLEEVSKKLEELEEEL